MPNRTVLLISSGYQLYREYLLRLIAQHARVWLLIDRELEWEQPYVIGSTQVNTMDVAAMVAAARALPEDVVLDGVVCWDEIRIALAAQVTEALGLPGGPASAVARCRDKHLTRQALDAAGVPQARSVLASSSEEAAFFAEEIGYPVIIKPRDLGASIGVSLVHQLDELKTAYAHAQSTHDRFAPSPGASVLVEEYMDGPEISVDGFLVNGLFTPMFIARKRTGFFPHFEEIGHTVDSADPLLEDPTLRAVLEAAHRAVGFETGITHTELRLTPQGPKIVEINARIGGDLIPFIANVASGIDPGRLVVDIACGRTPTIEPAPRGIAAIQFFYPQKDSITVSVRVDEQSLPANIHVATALAVPGQPLELPPKGHVASRYGYAVSKAETAAACVEAVKAAERAFELVAEPFRAGSA